MTDNTSSNNSDNLQNELEDLPQIPSETERPDRDEFEPEIIGDDAAGAGNDTVYSRRVFQTSSQSKRYTALLVVGCTMILVALYFLGLHHRSDAKNTKNANTASPLDLAMAKLQVDLQENKNAQTIIDRLVANPASRQIDGTDLQRNPFRPLGYQLVTKEQDEKVKAVKRQNRIKDLENAFKQFKLESIALRQGMPTCMINGELYLQGQKVSDDFNVKTIDKDSVILLAEEMEYILQF